MQNPLEGRAGEIASCREMAGGDDIGRKQRFREMTENILGRVRYLGKNDDIIAKILPKYRFFGENVANNVCILRQSPHTPGPVQADVVDINFFCEVFP